MNFEDHKKNQYKLGVSYSDYEYVNKNSRKTWPTLVAASLLGLGLIAFGWWRWDYFVSAEATGRTISLTTLEWGLYKIGGKWLLTGLFFLGGLFCIYGGIQNYQRLERMKHW